MSAGPQSSTQTRRASAWGALFTVVSAPAQTFESLRDRMPVLPGYVLQMIASLIALALTLPLSLSLAMEQAAKAGAPQAAVNVARWSGIGGGLFSALAMPWIIGIVIAGIAMFLGTFNGAGVSFGTYLGMVGYARLPLIVHGLVVSLMVYLAGSLQAVSKISLSLAVLAPSGASPVLRAFLATLNPFDLWYFILLAIGFGALHRTKPTRGIPLVLTLYVIGLGFGIAGAFMAAKYMPNL